jgi:hypothetical protein
MFWATMCPSSREITVSMQHLVFVSLCGWLSGMQGHPHRVTNTKCHRNTVISPDDGHSHLKHAEKIYIYILRKIVHQVGFIYKIIQDARSTKHKKMWHDPTLDCVVLLYGMKEYCSSLGRTCACCRRGATLAFIPLSSTPPALRMLILRYMWTGAPKQTQHTKE